MSERPVALRKIQALLHLDKPASLSPEPRSSREPLLMLEDKLRQIFSETKLPESVQPLVRSLVLLWHDYLDESHSIAQGIHNAEGSFLHGIMHRRERDYGNAKYWFRRVGEHPCFPEVAGRVTKLLRETNEKDLKTRLVPDGKWDAFAFVDAWENALAKGDQTVILLLRQIQEIEGKTLLEYFLFGTRSGVS